MIRVLIALPLVFAGYHAQHVGADIASEETLMCQQPGGNIYFVRMEGIKYIIKGVNGQPDAVVFEDTAGEKHILYKGAKPTDHCENAGWETRI